eukprot:4353885-Prorocentrum_lima.AAC.1
MATTLISTAASAMMRTTNTRWASSVAVQHRYICHQCFWDIEYPMYVWDTAMSCYITSFDEEEL